MEKLKFTVDDLYVFGDRSNDLPMLVKTENSFLINNKLNNFEPKQYFKHY